MLRTPVEIARQELALGMKEPEAFSKYAGGRNEHWCAHFASWVFLRAGSPLPGYKMPSLVPPRWNPVASVNTLYNEVAKEGKISQTPKPNDLIFYYRTGSSGKKGHVGIVTQVKDGKVVSIEGNLSDRVVQVTHRLNDPKIAGYGRVYSKDAVSAVGALALAGSFFVTWKLLKKK